MRLHDVGWMTIGAGAGTACGEMAGRLARTNDLRPQLRATGNVALVAFLAPTATRPGHAAGCHWWTYVGAHFAHARYLTAAALREMPYSATSRYGGALGYATIAVLGATGYSPGARPATQVAVRRVHRAGEQLLFGLYAFTIAHGYRAKGRQRAIYAPLTMLWMIAAVRGRARWDAARSM